MKRLILLSLFPLWLFAQGSQSPITYVTVDPAGSCSRTTPLRYNTSNGKLWGCDALTWTQIGSGGGGGSPGGSTGQIQFKASSTTFGGFTLSGDCTADTSTGIITCTKINGNTPGGACTNQVVTSISSSAVPTCSSVANAMLSNPATTVNGQTCTLGSTCTVTAAPNAAINLAASGAGGVTGLLANANIANPATTVNGQTCTLGSTCTVTAVATAVPWSAITNPTGNLSLAMASNTSTFTSGNATSTADLHVWTDTASNTGTGYLARFDTAASSTLKPFHVGAAGADSLLVNASGHTLVNTTADLGAMFTVLDTRNTSPRGILSWQTSTDTVGARVGFAKARGTAASPTIVASGDTIGRSMYRAYDGSNYLECASIEASVQGTVAVTRTPTQIDFATCTDAAPSVLTTAMTITKSQSIGFGVIPNTLVEMRQGNFGPTQQFRISAGTSPQITFYNTSSTSTLRTWGMAATLAADGDFALCQSASQGADPFGAGNACRMYWGRTGGVSIGNTTDAGAGNLSITGKVTPTAGVIGGGTTFTASGCSVGTLAGGATAGTMVSGTTGACTITITLPTAPTGWACAASDRTTPANLISQSASATNSCTITGSTLTNDVISFSAIGY